MTDNIRTTSGKRERTMSSILDAASELFAERGAGQVSVRDVAERAGVSHALVHRYFGNKDDLIAAAFDRSMEQVRDSISDAETAGDFVDSVMTLFLEQPLIARMMLRNLLEGWRVAPAEQHFPVVQRGLQLLAAEHASGEPPSAEPFDPRLVVAALAAMTLGWAASENRLVQSAGLADEDRARVRCELQRLIRRILAMADVASV